MTAFKLNAEKIWFIAIIPAPLLFNIKPVYAVPKTINNELFLWLS